MFGFLIGFGVFWTLICSAGVALFWNVGPKDQNGQIAAEISVAGLAISVIFLVSVGVGRLFM